MFFLNLQLQSLPILAATLSLIIAGGQNVYLDGRKGWKTEKMEGFAPPVSKTVEYRCLQAHSQTSARTWLAPKKLVELCCTTCVNVL
jgi:hypothetical protein